MRRPALLAALVLLAGCDGDPIRPGLVGRLTVIPAANTTQAVSLGGDAVVPLNHVVGLPITFSDPDPDAPWEVFVDWGDGSFSAAVRQAPGSFSLQHTYAELGSYDVTVTVSDDSSAGSDTKRLDVVERAPPVAVIASFTPQPAKEGAAVAFSSAGSHDPEGGPIVYRWEWGDGAAAQSVARIPPYSPSHRYRDQGTYTVVLIVTDTSGLTGRDSVAVSITNVAPTGNLLGPFSAVEGRGFTLGFSSVTDVGVADRPTLQVTINCGTTFRAYSAELTGSCNAPRDQDTITLRSRVRDKDGGIHEYSRVIPVHNFVPQADLAATTPTTVPVGGTVTLQGAFMDLGVLDHPWRWRIIWGDGTATPWTDAAAQGVLPVQSHAYLAPGTYTTRLFVRDKDGAQGHSSEVKVTVTP